MKRISFLLMLLFCFSAAYAQMKIGYVDSDAIMDKLPDAIDARQQIDQLVQQWQNELTKMEQEWKSKFDDYDKRKLIMSDQMRAETETDLMTLEKKIIEFREKKFGTNGELFQKQDELMKPVQNRVFNAIKEIASKEDFDYVFDKSGGVMLLFAKDKYDITNLVLDKLK